MDNERDYNENYQLRADDGKQSETFQLEQENQPSHVTSDKKEAAEGDVNGHLSRHKREPEVLESVYKYTNRIKSFLGWEPNEEEQENEKESGTSTLDDVHGNKNIEVECSSPDNTANEEGDCESLKGEVKNTNVSLPGDSEHVDGEKLDSLLQTDPMDDGHLINNSAISETGEIENEVMNPEVEANLSPSSINNLSDNNLKDMTSNSAYSGIKSESNIGRGNNLTPLMEEIKQPDLDSSPSFETAPKHQTSEILAEGNKSSDADVEKIIIPDEEENDKITSPDLEMSASEENEMFGKDILNTHSEHTIGSTNMDNTETKENGSCGENICESVESEDNINFYGNVSQENDVKNSYIAGIRRLSIDIVKDVIESARNSVHEIFANKNEQETITENEILNHDDNGATYVGNGRKILETENADGKQNLTHQFIEDDTVLKSHNEFTESKDNMKVTNHSQDHYECASDEENICGFGSYHPAWIQKYATPRIFLLFFSIVGIINGTYYTYVVSIISTLEKRYAFKTKVSGTILLADEITPLILGIIVGYVGGRTHRPRMVTLGMLSSAACCFVSALPYLMYGSAKHLVVHSVDNATSPELCFAEVGKQPCTSDDRPPTLTVVGIFLLASFLKGFATLSYYVIGISYMDDNIKKKNTPMYLAVALTLRLLGPLLGFLMSSAFLKLYENPFDDPGFGPDDPRWIGAWWMGFFLQGILLVIFTLPIALFPRRLPSQNKMEKPAPEPNKENVRETLIGLVAALKRLGKNPIFILLIINTTMKIFGHFGHAVMLPKYMENQFRLSAADASLFSGATSIFCIMMSTVLGGFLIWKYRPRIKILLGGMLTSEIILCIGFLILMIPRCQPAEMQHFGMDDNGLILDSVCNQNCDCSTTSFTPFCGPDGTTTYFSPCFAGCTQEITSNISTKKQMVFGNCSCVSGTNSPGLNSETITEGFCSDESCWSKMLAYLIILFILLTISNTLTVAHTMILLRSVHPGDKSIALGTFETFICLFGFIPFPVTFGALVDSACLVWEESCGESGNCWFYDMDKYRYLLHGASSVFCCLSTLCLITMYVLSSRVKDLYVDEEEEEYIDNIKLDTVSGSVTKL